MSKPYPNYRDSRMESLGKIPEHWDVKPLKSLASVNDETLAENTDTEYEIEYVDIGSVTLADGIQKTETFLFREAPSRARRLVKDGDVLVSTVRTYLKAIAPVKNPAPNLIASTGFAVVRPGANFSSRFARYVLQAPSFVEDVIARSTGVSYPAIKASDMACILLPAPPIAEQSAIAAFLDHETAKIDALVEEQRRLIELLKEKRQAVISHAVTKGLNPNTPMKDSGIEWLGEVPEHWEVISIKWLSQVKRGASPRPIDDPEYFDDDGEYAWVRIADVSACDGTLTATTQKLSDLGSSLSVKIKPGELFISIAGTVGKPCLSAIKACIHDGFVYFPTLKIDPQFLYRVFESGSCYGGLGKMGTQLNLNTDTIGSIRVALPPLDELKRLLDFLNDELAKLDKLAAEAMATVALLQERRTALISAAVTGKIDVRPAADVIPLPVDRARVRGLVATEIIERITNVEPLRRVKLQKLMYLAEVYVGISELKGNFIREAAGPWDGEMMDELDREAHAIIGVAIEQPRGRGTTATYRTTKRTGRHSAELATILGPDRTRKLGKLIVDLTYIGTGGAEAIATLYAVWNDALMDGKRPGDDEIVHGFLNDWHPEKREKFRDVNELHTWLDWMRRHGLVPTGTGPKVQRSRLI